MWLELFLLPLAVLRLGALGRLWIARRSLAPLSRLAERSQRSTFRLVLPAEASDG
jgi:hypothetical protein